jgi:diadenosine tetraphosphatase ApaH/serine/threonine PP2A family protein phosphatase
MRAFISDIHANFDALCAVCDDMDKQHIDDVVCLGDIVGYGAEPEACTDFVMERACLSMMGNHDYALLHDPLNFNPMAAEIIHITQERMRPEVQASPQSVYEPEHFGCHRHAAGAEPHCLILKHDKAARWDFLRRLETIVLEDKYLYVHASALDPISEYVFPDIFVQYWDTDRMRRMFDKTPWLIFCGHTHMPCAITSDLTCLYPDRLDYRLSLDPSVKYIINLGSVGQPRDGDPRSSYVLFDQQAGTVEWRRVTYDIDSSVKKIEAMCGKGNYCAARLRLGR